MKTWEKNIRQVVPYVPGEQPDYPGMIKLNTNENPYPPSPRVEARKRTLTTDSLKLYPDPGASHLTKTLAEYYGLKEEQVFVGVGSDDVIAMAFLTFFNSDKPILFPDITYSFYPVWADLYKIPYETVAVEADFHINPKGYERENGGIIIPNPNAPSGLYESVETIEHIIKANPDVIVMVDEAYIDFGGKSALSLLDTYENLLIIQTFSKARSMAGIRIGYAMGNEILIKALNAIKHSYNSYTMNLLSIELGSEAVKDKDYFEATLAKVIATRENAKKRFAALGFEFPDSQTNFLFVKHKERKAREIFQALRDNGIFVRYFDKPRIDEYLRVTIGTDEEMESLFQFLEDYLS